YEGFGFPVLEAFASGLPVVTSGAGGLKEVGGDAIVVVEGRDPAAYVQALESLSDDAMQREELVERGRARARTFTWQRTAEQTAEVYRRLLYGVAILPHFRSASPVGSPGPPADLAETKLQTNTPY